MFFTRVHVYPKDRGSRFLRNVGSYVRNYTAYHHTNQYLPNHHRSEPISCKSLTCDFAVTQHVYSVQCFIPRNTCVKKTCMKTEKCSGLLRFSLPRNFDTGCVLYKILYSSILRSCLGSCVSVPCYVHSVSLLYVYLFDICLPG